MVTTMSSRLHDPHDITSVIRSRDSLRKNIDEKRNENATIYDYMDLQPEITIESRAILINWVTIIHDEYNLFNETLYLTVNIIDRLLAAEVVRESELQVVGITAMFIATKYIEVQGSENGSRFYNDVFSDIDPCYERQRILDNEQRILARLSWRLSVPTLYTVIMEVIKAVEKPLETKIENMVYFYAELAMINYEIISKFDPLKVAVSAIFGACVTLKKNDVYEMLKKQVGFTEIPVLKCVKTIWESHSLASHDGKLKPIYEKYSSAARDEVAFYMSADVLIRHASRKLKILF